MGIPILDIGKAVVDIAGRFIPDPQKKLEFQLEVQKLADHALEREHQEMMGQIATNTEEAKSSSIFVAGWRPAVGWIGAAGVAYSFLAEPMASWVATVVFKYSGSFPSLNTDALLWLLAGMLGFGGLRSFEKIKGVPETSLTNDCPTPPPPPTVNGVPATSYPTPTPAPKKKGRKLPWPF